MHDHFQGKSPLAHLIDARKKGQAVSLEPHGVELSGHVSAAADAAKETSFLLATLSVLFFPLEKQAWFFLSFLAALLVWKVGRSALLGWSRLERLHRLIEEERWEIEHHRPQEKEELKALYQAKGFSGPLLENVVEVLMADDDRLLEVMLREELGLQLEIVEHPLKQALGAAVGVLGAAVLFSLGLFFLPLWGALASSGLILALSAGTTAELQNNRIVPAIIWNLGLGALSVLAAHFISACLP